MAYIPKRILYDEFPPEGIYGITNREALELSVEGVLPAYYHLNTFFEVIGNSMVGEQYIIGSYGNYHGPIARLPQGKLAYLEAHGAISFDSTTMMQVESFYDGKFGGTYAQKFGPPPEPAATRKAFEEEEFYWLGLEKGATFEMVRGRLIFMRDELEGLAAKRGYSGVSVDASDAALGAEIRRQRQSFAIRQREESGAREAEYERWRAAADAIQRGRTRPASKRELARLVRDQLQLPDSVETIRKQMV